MTTQQPPVSAKRPPSAAARYAAVPLVLAALLVAGCSGTGESPSSSAAKDSSIARADSGAGGSAADGSSGPADASEGTTSAQSKPGAVVPAALLADRRLVMTASLEVRVASASQGAARVRALIAQAGGYIANEQTSSTPPGDGPTPEPQPMDDSVGGAEPSSAVSKADRNPSATSLLTVRVPAAQLGSVTDQVAALGTVTQRSQASQDVTQQSVDVASRLATQRASIARIRVLLAKADRIGDIVNIEGELSRREADLESMQAQLKSLNDSVELSTLTVALVPKSAAPKKSDDDNGFVAGLHDGWDAFTGALVVGSTVVGAVLPFAVTLALLGLPVALVWRRRRAATQANVPAVLSEG